MVVESRSVKRNSKNARGLGRDRAATAPFPKLCACYFRFARFNTFPLYYLRAWHRLHDHRWQTVQFTRMLTGPWLHTEWRQHGSRPETTDYRVPIESTLALRTLRWYGQKLNPRQKQFADVWLIKVNSLYYGLSLMRTLTRGPGKIVHVVEIVIAVCRKFDRHKKGDRWNNI